MGGHFIRLGQFMHTIAFEAQGRRILAVVPHPKRVSMEHMARATQKPESVLKQRKLKDIEKETGFPVFVCPPFGHPKDSEGRSPLLLVDSSVTEQKRPLLFDCGSVGLSVMPSEFVSMTRAVCIEGLAKDQVADAAAVGSSGSSSGLGKEPAAVPVAAAAPEAKIDSQQSLPLQRSEMPACGLPQILTPEVGLRQAEVQQPVKAAGSSSMRPW